ncbi:EamA family transporter RarD [Solibacillus sp. FSL H8-0538]|uniref:EamA family transporter RarD n=1 Tax=Solibacillus sp. FSL H8-0538 TaxID=2921400 RepID=UPI0030FC9836
MNEEKKGILNAVGAYVIWGIFPLYWKMLEHVNSMEVLLGRVIWSFVFTTIFIVLIGQRKNLIADLKFLWSNKLQFWSLAGASVVITMNWYVYIWAVMNNHVLQSSLGYYINPLISVLFGMMFFKEKLSRATIVSVCIAAFGVAVLTFSSGSIPWVALLLALSFAVYGVLKKKIQLDATRGLAIETLFILPFALSYYMYILTKGNMSFLHVSTKTDMLLIVSGIVTAIPLVLFAKGAQRIPLYLMGFIQYLSPTIVLFLGILLYKEPFTQVEFIAFSFIWMALVIFSVSKVVETRRRHHIASVQH